MLSLAKILVPIEFSERCLGAARYAIPLVEHFRSELTLLHAVSLVGDLTPEAGVLNTARRQKAQKAMDDFLCAALNHLKTRRIVREGDPVEIIADQARHDHSDLIMMPTHGYGPFRRMLLGSVTAKVLHDAPCPVWTGAHLAQGPPAEWLRLAHVLCALDPGSQNVSVLRWAHSLAAAFQSTLTIVHVVQRLDSPGEDHYAREWRRRLVAEVGDATARLQQDAGTHAEVVLEPGEVSEAVARTAARLGADLVVAGRGGSLDARLGTNAYNIIRRSPCPVVTL
ncbi:MAG: universal stress protein [Bryobacterales bacterium]|nr:universal stress protein [Bryobacterales bacterium]